MTVEELKAMMKTEHVRSLEIKLHQGEILKANIEDTGDYYSFELLVHTKLGRRVIAGSYGAKGGIHYFCDMSLSYAQMLFNWVRS
ncbi:hypothetical protein J6TS7_16060 [Paenibacillus dendritiformis]|uniref:hypothetical protein n=1 Tax=Paenibacillus TaxID=44249 RepID=UPI001B1ED9FD|nr:hypothetical protein [Paenibacillus dendritiformis]GIO77996.1 hypothetical protein J6TS7_16060 [Paenibacillus dendritiformis]